MTRKFTTRRASAAASVSVSDGQAVISQVISVNGRVYRVDAENAVSVRVVSEGSEAYIEITDEHGTTRRAEFGELLRPDSPQAGHFCRRLYTCVMPPGLAGRIDFIDSRADVSGASAQLSGHFWHHGHMRPPGRKAFQAKP